LAKDPDLESVRFVLLNANPQDSWPAIAEESRLFEMTLPILKDEAQIVARALDIDRTGEILLMRPADQSIVWRGPLDDRLDYGRKKSRADHDYLEDAIRAVLAGEQLPVSPPPAKGCAITFRVPKDDPNLGFAESIAPILQRRCVSCHRQGGAGPFAMDSWKSIQGWSAMIKEVVLTQRMPPWLWDTRHLPIQETARLEPLEAAQLLAWIDAGAPTSDTDASLDVVPFSPTQPAPSPAGWEEDDPDMVVVLPPQAVAADGVLPYKYVYIDPRLAVDRWVSATQFLPGEPEVVHHAIIFHGDSFIDPNPVLLCAYLPHRNDHRIPFPDTAIHLPASALLSLELHYSPIGRPVLDRSRVEFSFLPETTSPAFAARFLSIYYRGIQIPPHAEHHVIRVSRILDRPIRLIGLTPHMHYRGKSARIVATYPDGDEEVLLSVPRYDFDWQRIYYLQHERHLPAGTRLTAHMVYDNSRHNPANPDPSAWVRWGLQSESEMLVVIFIHREPVSEQDPPRS
jgi:hypothetical protein